jgi:hypothetical protein
MLANPSSRLCVGAMCIVYYSTRHTGLEVHLFQTHSRAILFICFLFNDAVNSSDYIVSDDRMINELERMWKEAVVE